MLGEVEVIRNALDMTGQAIERELHAVLLTMRYWSQQVFKLSSSP